MKIKFTLLLVLLLGINLQAQQQKNNKNKLAALQQTLKNEKATKAAAVTNYLKKNNLPRIIRTDSTLIVANRINVFGQLEYLTTTNANAAKTSNTQKLYQGGSLGLSLDGAGIVVGLWDGGAARKTHQEFNNTGTPRVTVMEVVADNSHASHVAGTIIAGGVDPNAKGMAPNATIKSYDFNDDLAEMTAEVNTNDLKLSNHSYGGVVGWYWDGSAWQWANNMSVSLGHNEDYLFGYYDDSAKEYDNLCYLAPNYTMVKAASNDNGNGPGNGAFPDNGPYDCLPTSSNAKNCIVVGAVNDIVNGYTQPSDVVIASFSSTGPTDDGRIKPDIVANGVGLYSTYETSDTVYASISGTSMATPTVTGSIALLDQHYKNVYGSSSVMPSATVKALLLETAEEAGSNPGPDYIYGWGLMNTAKAAVKISESKNASILLNQQLLSNNATYTIKAIAKGTEAVKATVAWTDPAGTPITNISTVLDNPTKMLVNDLDFKITNANGTTYYPWSLNGAVPTAAATNSAKNDTDNVEGISAGTIAAGTVMTLTVNHVGTLSSGQQWFSMATDGLVNNDNFADAITIVPTEYSSTAAFYNTAIGTPDGANTTCAASAPKNNVWFKFVATSVNQSIFVLSDGTYGTLQKPVLSLWNSTGTTQIACNQGTAVNNAFINVDNLTIGQTYYVSVDNTNSIEAGTFTLFADASAIQSGTSTTTLEAGTIRYNDTLHKFQGWNGTQWLNFN